MALIKCIECGNEISNKAEVCPNCGCPVSETVKEKNNKKKKMLIMILIPIISIIMICCLVIGASLIIKRYNTKTGYYNNLKWGITSERLEKKLKDVEKGSKECCERVNPDIHVFEGRVVSGDQFISDKAKKEFILNTFAGDCTEMEGAAIAQAAYLNQIPFLIIRAISDKADDSATEDYPTFEAKAIAHSVKLVQAIVAGYANA